MRSLKDRLNSIKDQLKDPLYRNILNDQEISNTNLLTSIPGSKIVHYEEGRVLHRCITYPLPLSWGNKSVVGEYNLYPLLWLDKVTELRETSLDKILFFDLETTGLAGGTGTYPFLAGIGYFSDNSFKVQQVFLLDYAYEYAYLMHLNELFKSYEVIITFNGKSYDIPLINTRYKIHKIPYELKFPAHIDLLHPSRNLWKQSLENVKLKTLESNILGYERIGDIPGSEIPSAYFEYLTQGKVDDIVRVFEHNVYDIVSLACLSQSITQLIIPENTSHIHSAEELSGTGKLYYLRKEYESAIIFYEMALETAESIKLKTDIYRYLAQGCKKIRNYSKALLYWEKLSAISSYYKPVALIEMAMIYEHYKKDYLKSLQLVKECENCETYDIFQKSKKRKEDAKELCKRMNRLVIKCKRKGLSFNE